METALTKQIPENLSPGSTLPKPVIKDFLAAPLNPLPDPLQVAELILRYFFRAKDGFEKQVIFTPDGEEKTVTTFVRTRIPLLSEVARLVGMTKRELIEFARAFPDSVGRAVEASQDISDEYIVHNTLDGSYHPSAASLIAPNVSRIVPKQQVKVEDTRKLSSLLDEIEKEAKRSPTQNTIQTTLSDRSDDGIDSPEAQN